jgi:adenylate cyclase
MVIADIQGYTPMSQTVHGEELARLVGTWFLNCTEAINAHNGEIYQFLGDGFLAYWPDADASKVADALLALQRIQRADDRLPFRLVVHRGLVRIDNAVGEGDPKLIGPEVNFLFRMEKLAGHLKEQCLISQAAADKLPSVNQRCCVGEHQLKDFPQRHTFYSF